VAYSCRSKNKWINIFGTQLIQVISWGPEVGNHTAYHLEQACGRLVGVVPNSEKGKQAGMELTNIPYLASSSSSSFFYSSCSRCTCR